MSFLNISTNPTSQWKNYEKIALRFFIIYFAIQILPLDWKFYRELFSIDWLHLNFYDLFNLTRYTPQFFSLTGYANWGVVFIITALGTYAWTAVDRKERDYDTLYYWLRVALRYRLAIGVIAYGLIKLFPLQIPYPSLSNLHTNYGDFYPWKIYYHTIGITQGYESFLGAVEVLAGLLLLCRKTATFGAGLILGFVGNVFAANVAYNIGEEVYSAFLLLIAIFLVAYDVPRLNSLLFSGKFTIANKFNPDFGKDTLYKIRFALKTAAVVFVILLGFETYANYSGGSYKYPATPGLKGTYGYYNVREFKLNNQVIPYSNTNPDRWQNVVFEKWATLSIKTAKPITIDASPTDGYHENDKDRNYESAGVGGRRYFSYQTGGTKSSLLLENKNKHHQDEKFVLNYTHVNDSTIVLKGINEKKDSVYAVLDRINKKYLLFEGRRKPIKL
ncbi:MAG: DoxX family protein [Bacteroidota bacterium]